MKLSDKYFTKEPCNTGRQFELDVFRFILIYRLAVVHVFVDGSPPAALDSLGIPYYFGSVIGGVICPTRFMIVMGIGLAYTRHGSPKEVFQRGIKIGLIGLLLNVFRYLIPSLVGYAVSGAGFDTSFLDDETQTEHVGIKNTKARLRLMCRGGLSTLKAARTARR